MTTDTTKAVLFQRDPRRVVVEDIPIPRIGPVEVLVAAKSVGLCRSDNELLHGHLDRQLTIPYPVIPGHEWAGQVVEIAPDVTNVSPGDPVVGECVIAPNHWFGFTYHGAAAEVFRVPAHLLHRLPAGVDFSSGALVEPFTIAYKAVRVSGGVDASETVAIVGGGMIGQCALAVGRGSGATTVVIEPNPRRRALALALGADAVIDPSEGDVAQAFRDLTGTDGADLVVEASGHPIGIASTLVLARHAGRVVTIGICAHDEVPGPWGLVQAKDLTIRGTTGSSDVWPAALRFMQKQGIDLRPVITATYGLADAAEAVAATDDPENIKVHLTF